MDRRSPTRLATGREGFLEFLPMVWLGPGWRIRIVKLPNGLFQSVVQLTSIDEVVEPDRPTRLRADVEEARSAGSHGHLH